MRKLKILSLLCLPILILQACSIWEKTDAVQDRTVFLSLTFSGGVNPSSRAFTDGVPPYDEETEDQKALSTDDIYVLVFQNDMLIDRIKDLTATQIAGYWQLEGHFPNPEQLTGIEFIVLTNLNKNVSSTIAGELDGSYGQTIDQIYEKLLFNFNSLWNVQANRIPMWGSTGKMTLDQHSLEVHSSCSLLRAMAKLGFRINVDENDIALGYEQEKLKIKTVTVSNSCGQGYCAATSVPSVPNGAQYNVNLSYANNSGERFTKEYINQIYLLEQDTALHPLTIKVDYSINNQNRSREFLFDADENVIRNHSYLYNISLRKDGELDLEYKVMDWTNKPETGLGFN